jgi:hypothetical protein
MAGLQPGRSAALAEKIHRASELLGARERAGVHRVLPVMSALRPLLPGQGLRRGATIAVRRAAMETQPATGAGRPTGEGWHGETRRGETWRGETWRGETWRGETWRGETWRGETWRGETWRGETWRGETWPGETWHGEGWHGERQPATGPGRSTGARSAGRPGAGLVLATQPEGPRSDEAQSGGPVVAATSLMLALLAEASQAGSWCAVVGVPTLGAAAAAELGIALDRLALVPYPGPEWVNVVAALVDGVDVVVAAPPGPVSAQVASRLTARARQRGCVLVPLISWSGSPGSSHGRWEGTDVVLESVRAVWEGLGQGRGRLRRREVTISAYGRGAAARRRQVQVWLPATPDGWVGIGRDAKVGGGAAEPAGAAGRPALTVIDGAAVSDEDAADPVDQAV